MTTTAPNRNTVRALIGALVLALVGAAAWTLYRANQRNQRNVALWETVQTEDLLTVRSLLNEGADPNTNNYQVLDHQYGTTVGAIFTRLCWREPSYNQDPRTNRWTADPRVAGNWNTRQKWNTVLWLATKTDRPDIVRALMAWGREGRDDGLSQTALMWAAEHGHRDIAQSLLAAGSEVNATNDFGDTALDGAVMQGDVEMANLLLLHGAEIQRNGALARAKASGHRR